MTFIGLITAIVATLYFSSSKNYGTFKSIALGVVAGVLWPITWTVAIVVGCISLVRRLFGR